MDNTSQEFFIEITNKTKLEAFTRSAMLNLLEVAEEANAETVYICIRKSVDQKSNYFINDNNLSIFVALSSCLKSFQFIGFIQLTSQEQKKISMTQTHTLLKYKVKGDNDDY